MAYQDDEASVHGGKPIELFKYEGTYVSFYYTSGPRVITFNGDDYIPLNTERSSISITTQNDDNSEVTVSMPVGTDIISIYGFQISPPDLQLTIYRGHNAGEFIRYWRGAVDNINVERGTASLRVPSTLAAAMASDLPNVFYQGPCNHTLFDSRCKVSLDDWSYMTSIVSAIGKLVTVDNIGTLDEQLIGGELVLVSGERRMITSQVGNLITITYPFAKAEPDDVVTLVAGCDLAHLGDCKVKFDNTINFGGFPYIPTKNIFATGLKAGINAVDDNTCFPNPGGNTIMVVSFDVPGFTAANGTIRISHPLTQPNPPNGRSIIGCDNLHPAGVNVTEYDNPTLDPILQGQVLIDSNWTPSTYVAVFEFLYDVPIGAGWKLEFQYPPGNWTDVGHPEGTTVHVVRHIGSDSVELVSAPAAGLDAYEIPFSNS